MLGPRSTDSPRVDYGRGGQRDTVVEPDRPRHTMFDGPATLTMMAMDTSRIRLGTLVTSSYFREPVTFAKAAMTVDHLSGGRVELALGVGEPVAGAGASAVDWSTGERAGLSAGVAALYPEVA